MKRFLATTALATMAAMPLYAESHTGGDTTAATEQQGSMNDPVMTSGNLEIRGSNLMGKPVYVPGEGSTADEIDMELTDASDEWERAGEIGDIILNRDGEIKSITMDVGGFLGMGEKVVDASMDELKFVTDSDDEGEFFIVFTGDTSVLEDREEFDQASAEEQGDRMMSDQSDEGMSTAQSDQMQSEDDSDMADNSDASNMSDDENMSETADGSDATIVTEGGADTESADASTATTEEDGSETEMADNSDAEAMSEDDTEMAANDRAQQTRDALSTFTADELEGMPVYGSDGDRVGEVERIILTQDGSVETVVVDVGGFLGLGEKPVAVSLDELLTGQDPETGEMRLSVDHTEEELEGMDAWEEG